MPLNLYRSHFRVPGKCVGSHAPDSRSYEPEELRRAWRKCWRPIYADGTLGLRFKRRNTRKTTWPEARAVAAAWEARGSWDAPEGLASEAAPAPEPPQVHPSKPSVLIQLAADAYLANRAGREIAPATLRKYRTLTRQLCAFAAAKGYAMLDQFEITDLDEFYSGWRDGVRSKGKKLERLKGFFN